VPSLLSVRNLRVAAYSDSGNKGERELVRDISFTLGEDEVLAVVGESGSGKSISMAAVTKLLPQTRRFGVTGTIEVDGVDVGGYSDRQMDRVRRESFSMVYQDPISALNPLMRIRKQISESIPHRHSVDEVYQALDSVQIRDVEKVARMFPHELSGGMRQRVCIAMALAKRPRILIADEPTTALDATVQKAVLNLIKETRKAQSYSMILVTHDMGVVRYMADRIVVVNKGEVVETGTVDQIMKSPEHEYTKKLIDAAE
jgi:ABC-type glutathione transport system ATPase component